MGGNRSAYRLRKLGWRLALTSLFALLFAVFLAFARTVSANEPPPNRQGVETRIEIMVTGEVSAAQRAQIGDLMKLFEGQNPRLKIETKVQVPKKDEKEGENKVGKYYLLPITMVMLGLVATSAVAVQTRRQARFSLTLLGNIVAIATGSLVAVTGFLLIFGFKAGKGGFDVRYWHVVSSLIFVYLVLFHLVNNWRAWLSYGKRLASWMHGLRGG